MSSVFSSITGGAHFNRKKHGANIDMFAGKGVG
jgi:hypothetical protein